MSNLGLALIGLIALYLCGIGWLACVIYIIKRKINKSIS